MKIKLEEIIIALESINQDTQGFLNPDTGELFYWSDEFPDEEYDDIDDFEAHLEQESKIISLPDTFEINEYAMMESFAVFEKESSIHDELLYSLSLRKPFRHFKEAIHRLGFQKQWYAYRALKYQEKALGWCKDNKVEFEL
ncbi:UPF0158 family protein [Lactococcus lactis]|uniref:UPF0158 family protein n=1 Tax=Lactococcus lactis TaxID=1358 RepID=UPI0024A7B880|nr:UPF0158 family protein [Lactococcus lactis]